MALQTSGIIKLSQVRDEFLQTNPVKLSSYVKGGGVVSSTTTTTQTLTTAAQEISRIPHGRNEHPPAVTVTNIYNYFQNGYKPTQIFTSIYAGQAYVYVNGVYLFTSGNNNNTTRDITITISSANNGSFNWQSGDDGGGGLAYITLKAYSYQSTVTTQINQNVSTARTNLRLSSYYGARRV